MNTLIIKDLSVSKELDREAMSAVRGGLDTRIAGTDGEPVTQQPEQPHRLVTDRPDQILRYFKFD